MIKLQLIKNNQMIESVEYSSPKNFSLILHDLFKKLYIKPTKRLIFNDSIKISFDSSSKGHYDLILDRPREWDEYLWLEFQLFNAELCRGW